MSSEDPIQNSDSSVKVSTAANLYRNRIVTAPLPDPISKNIEAIVALHKQEYQKMPGHQRVLEEIAKFFIRPAFLYCLLGGLLLWIVLTLFYPRALPPGLQPFTWSGQGLDSAALLISTGVLVRQTRLEKSAEQRMQLTLQLNLLSEQKIAKIISLLEELRTDLPYVQNRYDPESQVMQEAADPIAVLEALKQNLTEELQSTTAEEAFQQEETQEEASILLED